MAAFWLVKQEPTTYSWSDLERDGETEWDGVHNALALRHLRGMAVGDLALFYHSGSERACVGILRIVRGPRPDPTDHRGSWTVRVRPVRRLARPISLTELRADPAFAQFDLVRISRLSVMPVSADRWKRLMERETAPSSEPPRLREGSPGRVRATGRRRPGSGARRTR